MTAQERRRQAALKYSSGADRAAILAMLAPAGAPRDVAVGDDGWLARRRALRQAGHEVKQFDGVVFVDGVRSDDPGLAP